MTAPGTAPQSHGATLEQSDGEGPPPSPAARAGRFWSARRIPAAVVALLSLAAVALLVYDLAAVRAGRRAMEWRVRLAGALAERSLDDLWVLGFALVAVLLGLWLLALALTPGLRAVLPMRRIPGGVRAGLDRRAAALVLRDRAMEVPGVRSVRVKVRRRRVKAVAQAHFRDPEEVRADLNSVLHDGVRQLGLARTPTLRATVRRIDRE